MLYYSGPASALGLLTVWSLRGNPGMARCLQDTSGSAKWYQRTAVGHLVSLFVLSVVGWLIVY